MVLNFVRNIWQFPITLAMKAVQPACINEPFYIPSNQNYVDLLIKQLPVPAFQYHFKGLLYDFGTGGACDIDPDG
jgi:hypothetical protein